MDKEFKINKVEQSVILEEPQSDDYHAKLFEKTDQPVLGVISPIEPPPVLFKDGRGWLKVASDYGLAEIQFNRHFDTFSCVVYSIAKSLCYYIFKHYGIKITISEMYNAFYAKVQPNRGTTIRRGMNSFKNHGWIADEKYPFTKHTTSKQFYSEPPKTVQVMAEGVLTEWNFHWNVIPNDLKSIARAYRRTPVVLTGFAWASKNGIYYDNNNRANHAFLGLEKLNNDGCNLIDDTYPRNRKYTENPVKDEMIKRLHPSFDYASAHTCWVTPTKKNNQLSIKYVISMLKKISRDLQGGFWFIKNIDGKPRKQKIENWPAMLGSIIDEVGVEKNNLTQQELAQIPDYNFFN